MSEMDRHKRLEWIAFLIQQEETGSLEEFAYKCEMKKRTLSDKIDTLRQYAGIAGAKIRYDKERKTYFFSPKGKFTDFKFIKFTDNQLFEN